MHQDAARFLSQPVAAQPGSPLRVAVYSRIAEAIRNGLLTPGSMIPTETELGADMKVSRTVVREALMLLEEDGLIRARRGVGRFVSDTLPRIGIERIRPFEEVLEGPGKTLEVKRTQALRQAASEFVAPGIGVVPGTDCWLWESVLIRDGEAIAHLQENVTAQPVSFGKGAAAPLEIEDDGGTTLLATLNNQLGRLAGPASARSASARWGPAGQNCWTSARPTRSWC
nr:GntR family transcriptional regulator [Arthrobacter sp. MAHUQ-56]